MCWMFLLSWQTDSMPIIDSLILRRQKKKKIIILGHLVEQQKVGFVGKVYLTLWQPHVNGNLSIMGLTLGYCCPFQILSLSP